MTFRSLTVLAPACAALVIAGFAAAPAAAAPLHKPALESAAHVTLVDQRDGRYRGDRGRGRDHDRGYRGRGRDDHRRYRSDYNYRPYYQTYRAPRYVYAPPPAYYYPYEGYYPYSSFSYSSPGFGFSLGY